MDYDKYYIDLSIQNSNAAILKNEELNYYIENNNNNNVDSIEGFGNFGRVNMEKCCPVNYMWSETQKKCIKICDGCGISAYGKINYEFLHSHSDEFFTFTTCEGDASGSYDYDKINKRYDKSELLNQYDMNMYIDGDPDMDGVQPAEENPWSSFSSYFDPVKGTSPGKGAAMIEAEHKRRRDAAEDGGFTQKLEILDKNMYYIESEITALKTDSKWNYNIDIDNNPYGKGQNPLPGSWKIQNYSEWISSKGIVKPIMYSLGTEFIPNKIIDPLDSTQKTDNIKFLSDLINEMGDSSNFGPVYDYYFNYNEIYTSDNSDAARRQTMINKRNELCTVVINVAGLSTSDSAPAAAAAPAPTPSTVNIFDEIYTKYCESNENQNSDWTQLCQQQIDETIDTTPASAEKTNICNVMKIPNITFNELCDIENISPCPA